jgi:hypothetical protein
MKFLKALMVIAVFGLLLTISAFAAPDTISPGDSGNTADLIVITKPPKDQSATFDRSYVISGYGKEGTVVTVYRLANGVYVRTDYSWTIGASTCFATPIELTQRKNYLRIRAADPSGLIQHADLEITYLGSNIQNIINGITVDPTSIPF